MKEEKQKSKPVKEKVPGQALPDGNAASKVDAPHVKEQNRAAGPQTKERRFRPTDLPAHFIERRRHPRIQTEPPPPAAPPRLEDYSAIIGKPELDEIRFLARHLQGKTVKMVNSTAVGGGVAEILNRLIPLMNELEIPTRWDGITGGEDFFQFTKGCSHRLLGWRFNPRT